MNPWRVVVAWLVVGIAFQLIFFHSLNLFNYTVWVDVIFWPFVLLYFWIKGVIIFAVVMIVIAIVAAMMFPNVKQLGAIWGKNVVNFFK